MSSDEMKPRTIVITNKLMSLAEAAEFVGLSRRVFRRDRRLGSGSGKGRGSWSLRRDYVDFWARIVDEARPFFGEVEPSL